MMSLSEKEEKILSILKNSEEKLNLTKLAQLIESSLPYTSQLVTMLEIKSLIRIERKDKRSKYVILTTESERKANTTVGTNEYLQTLNIALKLISFFTAHTDVIPQASNQKLLDSFTSEEREFINLYSDRIEQLEEVWAD